MLKKMKIDVDEKEDNRDNKKTFNQDLKTKEKYSNR
jgi:hypothetical protein